MEDLTHVRRQFRTNLTDPPPPSGLPDLDGERIEQCVLALDELMSDGLRHGRVPVEVEVCAAAAGVLILVHDRGPAHPRPPASTGGPAEGGMGHGVVGRVSLACGWTTREDETVVWALMPSSATA